VLVPELAPAPDDNTKQIELLREMLFSVQEQAGGGILTPADSQTLSFELRRNLPNSVLTRDRKKDPQIAKMYANLIAWMDPSVREAFVEDAQKVLRGVSRRAGFDEFGMGRTPGPQPFPPRDRTLFPVTPGSPRVREADRTGPVPINQQLRAFSDVSRARRGG
jgi:hypothetical protein